MNNPASLESMARSKVLPREQRRAQHAWNCVKDGVDDAYVRVAKGLPQLIMNSGLMQTLAFMQQKGGAHEQVSKQLRAWLSESFGGAAADPGFEAMMQKTLLRADPQQFQLFTAEALAWLKWLRQLAAAQKKS